MKSLFESASDSNQSDDHQSEDIERDETVARNVQEHVHLNRGQLEGILPFNRQLVCFVQPSTILVCGRCGKDNLVLL